MGVEGAAKEARLPVVTRGFFLVLVWREIIENGLTGGRKAQSPPWTQSLPKGGQS